MTWGGGGEGVAGERPSESVVTVPSSVASFGRETIAVNDSVSLTGQRLGRKTASKTGRWESVVSRRATV